MGKLRFYTCGKYGLSNLLGSSLVSSSGTANRRTVAVNWKGINTGTYSNLYISSTGSLFGVDLYATAETEQTFDESNYQYTEISGVTLTVQTSGDVVNSADGKVFRTVSVQLKNTNETAVTVPSITSTGSFGYSTSNYNTALSWCYIFDTPITLNADETKTVVFNFGYTLPTNND